ncbi:FASCICLIN-LIKE ARABINOGALACTAN PROTEIN 16 [Salix purpurea]|uniref:FASCICLIN-LIKE ARABINOGALACTAN PROTEIN 16 n=1 Tax=Salix purpurea TaxID=77065 RepID=A0A9Q0TTA9_SALPP|nr:FASCICLIN-LIKE ARABINOGALACTAN PROTEIN 16 [Salix purpurea]
MAMAMAQSSSNIFFTFLLFSTFHLGFSSSALQENRSNGTYSGQINSNSVLVALLDSHYTELAELVEKALLLQTLEDAVGKHNITIFAPKNEALERDLDPEFKRFLLEPGNLKSLQTLLLYHIVPDRVNLSHTSSVHHHSTLCSDRVKLSGQESGGNLIDSAKIIQVNAVERSDGVIHGIEKLLIPRSVQQDFNNRRSLRSISAVRPEGAPEVDPRTHRLKIPAPPEKPGSPPALPIYDAMAPGPSLAPASAPAPGGPHNHFNGEKQVKDFIETLLSYGGYNEMADILVNLTSLATEMGRLVSEGYVLTVLAPNDEAMAKLPTDQLSEPGAPEQIIYYHVIPEYQTEESMYNAVRRFGKISYDTLSLPHKVLSQEADGSVKFGDAEYSAYLFDPDIYTDGRISVQGIDGVLFPLEEKEKSETKTEIKSVKVAVKPQRRGMFHRILLALLVSDIGFGLNVSVVNLAGT